LAITAPTWQVLDKQDERDATGLRIEEVYRWRSEVKESSLSPFFTPNSEGFRLAINNK